MRVLDEKGRIFGKINVIDFLLVFVVIGVLAFVGYKFLQPKSVTFVPAEKVETVVTIYGNALHPFVVENIEKGDVIRLLSNDVVLGKVTNIESKPAVLHASTSEGEWVAAEVPGKRMAYISVTGQAVQKNGSFEIGGTPMLVGARIEIKGPTFTLEGMISGVEKK